jgi:FG-GAP-like repeat/PASTA domain
MLHRRLVIAIAASTLVLAGVASSAGTPAPSFLPAKIYPAGRDARAVAVGDLDGDGKPDLATANHHSDSVSVLLNAGRGSFRTRRDYLVAAGPLSVAAADLNADGKLDVLTASASAAAVSVLLNKGNGTFEPRRNYPTGDEPFDVAVGDLDGDGDPDLVTANFDFPGHVSVLLNNGDGSFADNRDFVTGDAPESIVVGDLNGDGSQDVATAGSAVSILLNAGGGILRSPHDISTGANLSSIGVGDLNGDGKPDLATASYESGSIFVLLNRGGGRFGTRAYRTVREPQSVAIGDLNGDRRVDIAVVSDEAIVSVLGNRGDGTLDAGREYLSSRPSPLAQGASIGIADVSSDGRSDIVTANEITNSVSVLLNRPGLCTVQDVRGLTLSVARLKLSRANCRAGSVRHARSKSVRRGRVVSQRPVFGSILPKGTRVTLVISRGAR